jgi:hypothetical protein
MSWPTTPGDTDLIIHLPGQISEREYATWIGCSNLMKNAFSQGVSLAINTPIIRRNRNVAVT